MGNMKKVLVLMSFLVVLTFFMGAVSAVSLNSSDMALASSGVKNYTEANGHISSYVNVNGKNSTTPSFLKSLTAYTAELGSGSTAPVDIVTGVRTAPNPAGSTTGKIYKTEYLDMASRASNFITANGYAPNYSKSSLGNIRYESLVYAYSKIINYYALHGALPNYVTIVCYAGTSSTGLTIDNIPPTVTCDLPSGTYDTSKNATLTATDNVNSNPTIYYSLDGSTPTTSSTRYTGPVSIVNPGSTVLKFMAMDTAGNKAAVQTVNYILNLVKDVNTGKVYSKIQDAIDDSSTSNDDVITLQSGTYIENIIINKQLTLMPTPGATPTIQALNPINPVITINSGGTGSIIKYLTIKSIENFTGPNADNFADLSGVFLNGTSNCTINENSFLNTAEGIYLDGGSNNKIQNNTITNIFAYGISLSNTLNNTINGNVITTLPSAANNTCTGIFIGFSRYNLINRNIITNNQFGIYPYGSNNNIITENIIKNNSNYGIYLYNSSATINFNIISGNGIAGLNNQDNGTVNATNNWWGTNTPTILLNIPSDIHIVSGTVRYDPWLVLNLNCSSIGVTHDNYTSDLTVDLTHNNLGVDTSSIGRVPDGIVINFITTLGTINATTVTTDGLALVTLNSSVTSGLANVTATLDNQTVSVVPRVFSTIQAAINDNSTYNGDSIEIEDGTYTENIVLNKEVTLVPVNKGTVIVEPLDPSKPVIKVTSGGSGSLIQDLNINGVNSAYAIFVDSAHNCSIIGDNITGSQFGIYFNNSTNSTISENNIANNYNGVYIFNSPNITISSSTVSNNTGNGIYLDTSNSTEISENAILNNKLNGICTNNSLNTTIFENNILNNALDGIYLNNSSATINFNRIIGNGMYGTENQGNETVDATNNWWGSNNGPSVSSLKNVTCNTWLILNINSSYDRSNSSGSYYNNLVKADLNHNNQGNDTSPDGKIPDNLPLYFNTTLGTINSTASTKNGEVVVTLNNTVGGTVNVSATLDNQTVATSINVTSVNNLGIYNIRTGEGFNTIQSAIDSPDTLNGDVITLADGTYTENVTFNKKVTIKPVTGANVTVKAADTNTNVFTITNTGSGSTITGLNIINGLNGIYLDSVDNCNITGNNISSNSYGIYLNSSNSSNITGNNIKNNYYGIFVYSSNSTILNGNNITNNFEGISFNTSNNSNITRNIVTSNWNGIYLSNSNSTLIINNIITNNGVGIDYINSNSTIIDESNNVTGSWIENILEIDPTGIVMWDFIFNCGPASLATVLQRFGINVSQEDLAFFAGTDLTGTTMYGLVQAAKEEGLTAEGLKLAVNQLEPGNIVFLTMNGEGHFSVITNITDTMVYLADSDLGNINMTLDNFMLMFPRSLSAR